MMRRLGAANIGPDCNAFAKSARAEWLMRQPVPADALEGHVARNVLDLPRIAPGWR